MRLARYERAGEARLAMVAGEDILDILDALDDLSDARANGTRDYGFPVGREGVTRRVSTITALYLSVLDSRRLPLGCSD